MSGEIWGGSNESSANAQGGAKQLFDGAGTFGHEEVLALAGAPAAQIAC